MTRPRSRQCKACPWKRSTRPASDIPGGYDADKHRQLIVCQSDVVAGPPRAIRAMACHESAPGAEYPCVGWVVNQLGPGNNLVMRMRAMTGEFSGYRTSGPQYDSLEAMCASAGGAR